MRWSQYFLKTMKDQPKDAKVVSHNLMLRAGMIRQMSAGLYTWLPLGLRVLKKVEQIVREEQNRAGFHEVLMPTIQSADLWQESGRYDAYGPEMLRIKDRHNTDLLYGPTNEEVITDIFRREVQSYKDLPLNLYHIQWKFRDEVRPRFGLMRGREFLMKDGYSFDIDADAARSMYQRVLMSYLRTFSRLGVTAIPMRADTGPIGGDLSHEFLIQAETGESDIYFDGQIADMDVFFDDGQDQDMVATYEALTTLYARTDETHDPAVFAQIPSNRRVSSKGIEVGHIFNFGTKYSAPMGATVQTGEGDNAPVHMGSYGIGISRIVAALIEASHDAAGIIWPQAVAPFDVGILILKPGDEDCEAAASRLHSDLSKMGKTVLIDDRDERPGAKFADMDLIGLPQQIILGPRGLKNGVAEIKDRRSGQRSDVALDQLISRVVGGNL